MYFPFDIDEQEEDLYDSDNMPIPQLFATTESKFFKILFTFSVSYNSTYRLFSFDIVRQEDDLSQTCYQPLRTTWHQPIEPIDSNLEPPEILVQVFTEPLQQEQCYRNDVWSIRNNPRTAILDLRIPVCYSDRDGNKISRIILHFILQFLNFCFFRGLFTKFTSSEKLKLIELLSLLSEKLLITRCRITSEFSV